MFAFALVLGELNDIIWTTGAGAINMGFPAVCDTDVPVIHPTGVCTYEEVDKEFDHGKIVRRPLRSEDSRSLSKAADTCRIRSGIRR
jgi:acetyl-CoA synthase